MTVPFFYIIRHIDSGKKYAGVKFAKGCHPSDIMTRYFTSSKVVKSLLNENRDNFKVIKTIQFDTKEDAIEFEEFFLKEVNAHMSDDWLNQAAGKAINPEAVKKTCLKKYGIANASSLQSVRDKVKNTCNNKFGVDNIFESDHFKVERKNTMFSKYGVEYSTQSEEISQKIKLSYLNKYGVDNPSKIDKNRELHSVLMSQKNKVLKQCEHCGIVCNTGNYHRWHGSNCNRKPKD